MAPIEKENTVTRTASDRPLSGGRDLSCYGAERLPELHSPSPAGGHRGTVHGGPLRLALPVGDLRVSAPRSGAAVGQPLRAVGAGHARACDRQHSRLPFLDGPERTSIGRLCRCAMGVDLRQRSTGLCRLIPIALAATSLIGPV